MKIHQNSLYLKEIFGILFLAIIFALMIVILTGKTRIESSIPGKIFDVDTHKPVSGAVVMAIWYSENFRLTIESKSEYFDYYEVLSNAEGEFVIQGRGLIFPRDIPPPQIKIFKTEYQLANLGRLDQLAIGHEHSRYKLDFVDGKLIIYVRKISLEKFRESVMECRRYPFSKMAISNVPLSKFQLYTEELERAYKMLGETPPWRRERQFLQIRPGGVYPPETIEVKPSKKDDY